MDSFANAILSAEISIEIDLGLTDSLQVRVDHNSYFKVVSELYVIQEAWWCVPFSCCVDRSKPRYNGPASDPILKSCDEMELQLQSKEESQIVLHRVALQDLVLISNLKTKKLKSTKSAA